MSYRKVIAEKKKKRLAWWSFGILLIVVLIAVSLVAWRSFAFLSQPLEMSDEELGIESVAEEEEEEEPAVELDPDDVFVHTPNPNDILGQGDIFHMALFGLDKRSQKEKNARSDSMMIATIDLRHNKIKLTSLLRDQVVSIDGHGEDKLNHAYAYGGPELALRTINQNFGLDVRHYAMVDFFTFQKAIDALGGVQIDVLPREVKLLDKHAREVAKLENRPYVPYTLGDRLNGEKAVSYSRIRYVGDGDFERSDRQRRVLNALFEEVQEKNVLQLANAWMKVAPFIETSLSKTEALELARVLEEHRYLTKEEIRFPLDDTWSGKYLANGMWVMQLDRVLQKERIQRYLYDDIHPTAVVEPSSDEETNVSEQASIE